MPTRVPHHTHGSRGDLQTRPPGPGPPQLVPQGLETSGPHYLCQSHPGAHRARPKKIVFEDELPSQAHLGTKKPVGSIPVGPVSRPYPVPDYELKYPAVSSERERSCYAAVFQDQYAEFLELQQQLDSAQKKLQQLKALLTSLPAPRSQKEAQVAARVWREFEKKRTVSHGLLNLTAWPLHPDTPVSAQFHRKKTGAQRGKPRVKQLEGHKPDCHKDFPGSHPAQDPIFLDKQARCRYLKSKLRHLKAQIQKFDNQGDSEGSVYF